VIDQLDQFNKALRLPHRNITHIDKTMLFNLSKMDGIRKIIIMMDKTNNILKPVFLSWIILFGLVLNHSECRTLISDICFQKNLPYDLQQALVLPANLLAQNAMSGCRDGACCEEKKCNDEGNISISSGQYIDKIKQIWGSGNKIVFTGNKSKKLFDGSYQNIPPKTNSIFIFTQSFLC